MRKNEVKSAAAAAPAETRDRLLAAAKSLFCAKGYHAVGTQEICETAGVLKGSFYHFFPAKLDLALAVLDQFAESTRDEFAAAATAGPGGPAKRLIRVFDLDRGMVARQKRESGRVLGCLYGNFTLELAAVEPRAAERIAAITAEWADAITAPIQELIKNGTIPKQNATDAARSVLSLLQGSVLIAKATNDPDVIIRQGRSVVRLLGGSELTPMP